MFLHVKLFVISLCIPIVFTAPETSTTHQKTDTPGKTTETSDKSTELHGKKEELSSKPVEVSDDKQVKPITKENPDQKSGVRKENLSVSQDAVTGGTNAKNQPKREITYSHSGKTMIFQPTDDYDTAAAKAKIEIARRVMAIRKKALE